MNFVKELLFPVMSIISVLESKKKKIKPKKIINLIITSFWLKRVSIRCSNLKL